VQHSAALLTELTRLPQQGAAYEGRRKRKKDKKENREKI
jgi:hypothetical protein